MDILTFIGGIFTGGVGTKLLEKLIDWKVREISEDKKQKKLNRYQLSTEVLKILNEGSNKGWRKKPNDVNHLNFIGRELQMEDMDLSVKYDSLINTWQLAAGRDNSFMVGVIHWGQPLPPEKQIRFDEDQKFIESSVAKADKLDKEITEELRKWRK